MGVAYHDCGLELHEVLPDAPVLPSSSLVRAIREFKQQSTLSWPPERCGRAAGLQVTGYSAVVGSCGLLGFFLFASSIWPI